MVQSPTKKKPTQEFPRSHVDNLSLLAGRYAMCRALEKQLPKGYFGRLSLALVVCGVFLYYCGLIACCDFVSLVYPAYKSFKVLRGNRLADHVHWLVYWVVFAMFNIVTAFTDTLFFWFPHYSLFRISFIAWCFLPQTQGSLLVYENICRPLFVPRIDSIDQSLETIKRKASEVGEEFKAVGSEVIFGLAKSAMSRPADDEIEVSQKSNSNCKVSAVAPETQCDVNIEKFRQEKKYVT